MSENELLNMARREEEHLLDALSQNAEFQKLQIVRRLISGYERFEPELEVGRRVAPAERLAPTVKPRTVPRQSGRKKHAALEEWLVKYFDERGARIQSGQLFTFVQQAGFKFGGKAPSRALASFLSNSDRFNNVLNEGYGLSEWGEGAGPKATTLRNNIAQHSDLVRLFDDSPSGQPQSSEIPGGEAGNEIGHP